MDVSRVADGLATPAMGTLTTRLLWRCGYETPVFQAFAGQFLGEA
ncbi:MULTISPECIES: hypothetical protein [unclassified Modicisalibacter]|nr:MULTISPECIES: hypothetical protein [unclassified Modicisalibacter]